MLTAFFVMLREGFEAALIVAILYAYLRKTSRQDLIPAMWGGVAAAAALSVVAGVAIHLSIDALEGEARLRAFAAISVFAVVVLTWMIFWMRKHARAIKGELQEVLDDAMRRSGRVKWAIVAAALLRGAPRGTRGGSVHDRHRHHRGRRRGAARSGDRAGRGLRARLGGRPRRQAAADEAVLPGDRAWPDPLRRRAARAHGDVPADLGRPGHRLEQRLRPDRRSRSSRSRPRPGASWARCSAGTRGPPSSRSSPTSPTSAS